MGPVELGAEDHELIEEAKRTADALHLDPVHKVASALRTRSGLIFAGINIETSMPFADVCGEVAAISAMVGAGHRDLETIVAIRGDGQGHHEILPPCGRCRELISDFDQETWVIVGTLNWPYKVSMVELLPLKPW